MYTIKYLSQLKQFLDHNQFNEVVLKHKIAMLYNEVGEYDKSYILCNEILDFNFKSAKIEERLDDRIRRAKVLRENLEEKLNSKN